MMALSAHSLDVTFRSLLSASAPHCDLFCSSQRDYTQHLGIGPFPVCEVIHIATVMHYGLWESRLSSVCVLWLGSLTQTTPVNGLYCSFSSLRLVWYSLSTHRNPQGVLITSHNLVVLSRSWSLHATCYFLLLSLCFCPQLIMNPDFLITVKCCQSWEVRDYWVKFENLCVGERQRDNGLCSQYAEASNCKLKV